MVDSSLKNVSILVVDDTTLMQQLIHDVLKRLGFQKVVVVNSGRKAIELVAQHSFDFIITDWRMDDMTGIDLIRYVRTAPQSRNPHIPIIMLTGNSEVRDVIEARDVGVNEYMIKPFSAEQLVKRIRSVIEHPRRFVEAANYNGPDRRRVLQFPLKGAERRKRRA